MSQNSIVLPTTGTVSGLQMTQDTNNALDTLNTLASGASAPGSPEAGQLWHDTTANIIRIRSLDNTTWIPLYNLNESSYLSGPYSSPGGTNDRLNRIINGGMQIDQVNEGASYAVSTSNAQAYALDQWIVTCQSAGASGVTAQRVADAPSGLTNSLKVTVGTGSAVGASEFLLINQKIEGNFVDDLAYGTANARPASLSFWVKSSQTGTFAVSLMNSSNLRAYVASFTIASANTWTLVTIQNIPGDQSGTWLTGSNVGLILFITVAMGTTWQTSTLNAWQGGPEWASTAQTNSVLSTNGATFQVAGVQLNSGPFNQAFEKRPYANELDLCLRYYEKTFLQGTAVAQAAGTGTGEIFILSNNTAVGTNYYLWPFAVKKRTAATIVTYNPNASNANWRDTTTSADKLVGSLGSTDGYAGLYVNATTAVSDNLRIHITANARM